MAKLMNAEKFSTLGIEFLQIVALMFCVLLYQTPLNIFLIGKNFKKSLLVSLKSFVIVLMSWFIYRLTFEQALAQERVSLLLTLLVSLNALYYWTLIRFRTQSSEDFLEGRVWGWILFSPLLTIAEIISAPLLAAIIKSLA